ncbi:MAG: peptidoglycan editing factor PgeF [Clostridia bacterium]
MKNKDYTNKSVIHVKKGDVEYLKFKSLERYSDKLVNAVTLRHGGVSTGECKSLSFRLKGKDEIKNVYKNIEIICKIININKNQIYRASMKHTNNVLIIDEKNKFEYEFDKFSNKEYDAYITKEKNVALFVNTADCTPIIFYDCIKNIIGLAHAGWKGTVSKIHVNVINDFISKFNSNPEDIIVCLAPSIGKCCFSSREENFKKEFTNVWENEENYIKIDQDETFYIDTHYLIKKDLLQLGIKKKNITDSNICTNCNFEDFFSYRKSKSLGYTDYGLLATVVALK